MQDYLEELLDQPLLVAAGVVDWELDLDDDLDEWVDV